MNKDKLSKMFFNLGTFLMAMGFLHFFLFTSLFGIDFFNIKSIFIVSIIIHGIALVCFITSLIITIIDYYSGKERRQG